jgi:polar amino acid transport system substrate-binding protein
MIKSKLILLVSIIVLLSSFLNAKEYKAAIKQLATTDTYVNLINAIGQESGNSFNIQIVPPARADFLVENGEVDIQFPIIVPKNTNQLKNSKCDYATIVLYKLAFVLFTNKNKSININDLKNGNLKKYQIEADASIINYIEFPVIKSTNSEASLNKVNDGTIDGYIFAQSSTDVILKKSKLTNIKRQLWDNFDLTFSLIKGTKNGELDKSLTMGINKIKANGKYNELIGPMVKAATYDNWQP